jgi:2-polyprenyl-3-methyl-5-hydroxy-6-metoxy-1,4-benzoquinol methylase
VLKDYKRKLFKSYNSIHVAYLDTDEQSKLDWFVKYVKRNYLPHIDRYGRNSSKILEIGCNRGYMLAALKSFGFQNLHGVDLSSGDLEKAKILVSSAEVACADAFDYLKDKLDQFDIIILKAVLEHVQKDEIMPFLEKIKGSLRLGGSVIIDIPNMDWLFASHERYMDFTHEIGFTKESLGQIMRSLFLSVQVIEADNIFDSSLLAALKRKTGRFILKKLLTWADPEGGINPIWERSIIGIGKK